MEEQSDGTLLGAWSGGDAEAFTALVRRHEGPVLRYAQALLGNWRGGEDVVQEVFLRLSQKPPTLPEHAVGDAEAERSLLSGWLHQVTRNLCMDTKRSEHRRRHREEAVASLETDGGGIDTVEARDTRAAVERGLSKLPSEQREVLALRLFGEKSYKEIAGITGKKIGTIGWLVSVGLKSLAGDLAPLLQAPGPVDAAARAPGQSPGQRTGIQSLPGGLS